MKQKVTKKKKKKKKTKTKTKKPNKRPSTNKNFAHPFGLLNIFEARKDLGPVEGETPRGLARWASSFNGYTAEEEGELSFAEGEEVEILVHPPEQEGEAREKNEESRFVPSDHFNPTAVVKPKVVEPILSSGPPQENPRGELHHIARAPWDYGGGRRGDPLREEQRASAIKLRGCRGMVGSPEDRWERRARAFESLRSPESLRGHLFTTSCYSSYNHPSRSC